MRSENDEDEWLMNPEWKIRPSIAFINNSPQVMTCLDHKNGTSEMMIHPYRWKHCLSADQPDQIAEIVVQSLTIKKAKASLYSTEWQIFQQNGSFSGIDTYDHV